MLNLLRMEQYRMRRTSVVWVTLIIAAALSIMTVLITVFTPGNTEVPNISKLFTSSIADQISLVLWAVSISVYITGEYKNGFIKSIGGQIESRMNLIISKIHFVVLYTLFMYIVCFVSVAGTTLIASGSHFEFGFTPGVLGVWLAQFLLHLGFGAVFIFVANITRSAALSISIGSFMGAGITSLLYYGMEWALGRIGTDVSISKYMIEGCVSELKQGAPWGAITRCFIVAIIYFAIFICLSIYTMKKKDIQ